MTDVFFYDIKKGYLLLFGFTMKIVLIIKNLSQSLNLDEIKIVNTIINKIEYKDLRTILSNTYSEEKLKELLYSLCSKQIIEIDDNSFFSQSLSQTKTQSQNTVKAQTGQYEIKNLISTNTNNEFDKVKSDKFLADIDLMFDKMEKNNIYYNIFNLMPTASVEEIKSRYIELSKRFHPDIACKYNLNSNYLKKVETIAIKLSNIYNTLKSVDKRKKYDDSIGITAKNLIKDDFLKNQPQTYQKNLEQSKEFYNFAMNEYMGNNYSKALNLVKMAINYYAKDLRYTQLKTDIETRMAEKEKSQLQSAIDKAIFSQNYEDALKYIDAYLEKCNNIKILIKKAEVLELMNWTQFQDEIFKILEKGISLDSKNVIIRETYLNYLKKADKYDLLEKEAQFLLQLDSENKTAKKYTKKRSLWNIFSVLI